MTFLKNLLQITFPASLFLLSAKGVFAATPEESIGKINAPNVNLGEIVKNLLLVALFAAALFFLVQVILGGISWISSGGDQKSLDSARGRITNAVIGLVIVVAAFAISLVITSALGVNIFTGTITIGE